MQNNYINTLKENISKEALEEQYVTNLNSVESCSKYFNTTTHAISVLIKEYNLIRDEHMFRQKINKKSGNKQFEKIKTAISKEALYQYYVEEDHGYYETIKYFGISEWNFIHLLKEYNIYKDRKETCKKSVATRYEKAGGKEAYLKQTQEKSDQTKIARYGSIENYKNHLSSKCIQTWSEIPCEKKQEIQSRVRANGGGWNHETAIKTLQEKYGVDNAYKLASNFQNNSVVNKLFENILEKNSIPYIREFQLGNYRYDFKVNDFLIEINPWPFHNSSWCPLEGVEPRDKNYHLYKTKNAIEKGYFCIHIWDWDDTQKIVNMLKSKEVIYARKCLIKEITREEAKEFLNINHLQGYARDKVRFGLFFNDVLISVMTFGKPRYNKNYEWELIRYCSSKAVVGGANKLFKQFIVQYAPKSIISYCDLSKFSGKIYTELGFNYLRESQPAKHWWNIQTQQHITDNLLRQQGFDRLLGEQYGYYGKGTNNEQLMLENRFVAVYDCGQKVFEWNN